ncbi:hypothetical protein [Halobacillus campisalis]|uniref:Subunit I/II of b(O/a)3-type cytochrome C oxidase n=1 Tax=Halobacillus campisalis TaxID=435909 RepID=A0ABW2K5E8_9BACI|nr:hypothetical protein [Halobacillus campisalis]
MSQPSGNQKEDQSSRKTSGSLERLKYILYLLIFFSILWVIANYLLV